MFTPYPVTVGNANTANVTEVFSSTIPATEWANNEIVDYFINCEQKQNSGASASCVVQMIIQGIPFTVSNSSVPNNGGTGKHFIVGRLYREGNKLYIGRSSSSIVSAPSATDDFSGALGFGAIISDDDLGSDIDFNADIDIVVTVDWGTGTNVMYKALSGKLWKF